MIPTNEIAVVNGEFNFEDLAPREVPVRIKGREYILREPTEAAAITYRKASMMGSEFVTDGEGNTTVRKLEGAAGVEPLLVSLCLFSVDSIAIPNQEPRVVYNVVRRETVESWPSRIVKPLFQKCKEMGDLDETETVEDLERQINTLQRRLNKLKGKGKSSEDPTSQLPKVETATLD